MTIIEAPSPPTLRRPSPEQTLRRLFLTLFLRGRSSRGLKKKGAPRSVAQKLTWTLLFYLALGSMALIFQKQPVFALAVYLHAMTFVFLGLFVASSAGEILFNKEEADILLHRPITARALLWAKIGVLVQVSLWLAGSFNFVGLFVGMRSSDGDWRFPIVHAISIAFEALFSTGCVVLVYQLCLRWFGRERLEGLMTTAQVFVSLIAVLGGQVLPRLVFQIGKIVTFNEKTWWYILIPPAWFAGFDDALAGSGTKGAWLMAGIALLATTLVLWFAFAKLADDYQGGLQKLGETVSRRAGKKSGRRWLDRLVGMPPLSWWLRDSVARASFLLTTAYIVRDRDVKLRLYPALAPILVMPLIFVGQEMGHGGVRSGFGTAFLGGYIGVIPLMGLNLLQYSQQWQASDIFRVAPMFGPASLCKGARRAVLCFLTFPLLTIFACIIWVLHHDAQQLMMLIPGIIALPVFALVPNIGGKGVPLSLPSEDAKAAGRGLTMMVAFIISLGISGLASLSWNMGIFGWYLLAEVVLATAIYGLIHFFTRNARWSSIE